MKSAFTVCCEHVLPKSISSYQVKDSGTFHPQTPHFGNRIIWAEGSRYSSPLPSPRKDCQWLETLDTLSVELAEGT